MLVWLVALATVLLVTPLLFVLARLPGHNVKASHDAPLLKRLLLMALPDWVVHEVLRLKALMGKQVGCRKVADTFNRLHAPTRVGKSFVSNTIRNHQWRASGPLHR